MKTICVIAVGDVPSHVMGWVENAASDWCPLPVRRLPPLCVPKDSFDAKRRQYRSGEIMKAVSRCAPADAARILGVTELDLMIPTLTFVFGQAQLDGAIAVVSLCRLRQEFYGVAADEGQLRERVVKEVLHEMGHTYGLTHCPDPKCAMSMATHIGLVDDKEQSYCARCGSQLARRFADGE